MKRKRIKIFRGGPQVTAAGQQINFSESDLDGVVKSYDPATHEAPIVFGHPKDGAQAHGWVKAVEREGDLLFAEADFADEAVEAVKAGGYRKVSASFYGPADQRNPKPGSYHLRHVGLLGAQVPAVKGLGSVEFGDGGDGVTIEFDFAEADPAPAPVPTPAAPENPPTPEPVPPGPAPEPAPGAAPAPDLEDALAKIAAREAAIAAREAKLAAAVSLVRCASAEAAARSRRIFLSRARAASSSTLRSPSTMRTCASVDRVPWAAAQAASTSPAAALRSDADASPAAWS